MLRRYSLLTIVVAIGIWVSLGMVSCGNGGGNSNDSGTTKLDDDVTEMVRYYQQAKAVGLNGLVDRFLSMRDSVTNAHIDTYYTWRGWELDSAKVYQLAGNWPDVAGLPLVQDSTVGRWRRLIFRQCGLMDDDDREHCMYPVVLFGKNGDQWKPSNAYRIGQPRYREDGSERTVAGLTFHKLFTLPPSFIDLKPREGEPEIPEMQKVPIDPKTGKPIKQPPGDS